jgi:hypothetical protein
MRTIKYDRKNLAATLRSLLVESVRETLGRYEVRRESRTIKVLEKTAFAVAVTGSLKAEPARCMRRVESLLSPYVSENTVWYVGSFGTADETVARYLGGVKQKVIVVGYNSYDVSEKMLEIMEKYDFPFVAANMEQLPKGIEAPSERDLLFAMKTDLIILLWNGKSTVTQRLITWFQQQGKDHVVGFI